MSGCAKTPQNLTPTLPLKTLTAIGISRLKPSGTRYEVRDAGCRGLRVVVQPTGHKSFHMRLWFRGRGYNITLGPWLDAPTTGTEPVLGAPLTLADARMLATQCLRQVMGGKHPNTLKQRAVDDNSVQAIADEYMAREGSKLRTAIQRKYDLGLVCASLGTRPIADIKVSDIVRLRDKLESENGPRAASRALTSWRTLAAWHASRTDDFRPPIIRKLIGASTPRSRILSDDELRAIWRAAEAYEGPFGAYIKFLLLTAARRNEAADMRRSELVDAYTWVIPAARYKTAMDTLVPLSRAACDVINTIRVIGPGDLVFTYDGRRPFRSFVRPKKDFDRLSGVTGWRLHDLRRTARTLMSRAGVDADVAERCLGHAIGGVRATYDRHEFEQQKRKAFEALAAMIETIIRGPAENVVLLGSVAVSG
jgi:integrase